MLTFSSNSMHPINATFFTLTLFGAFLIERSNTRWYYLSNHQARRRVKYLREKHQREWLGSTHEQRVRHLLHASFRSNVLPPTEIAEEPEFDLPENASAQVGGDLGTPSNEAAAGAATAGHGTSEANIISTLTDSKAGVVISGTADTIVSVPVNMEPMLPTNPVGPTWTLLKDLERANLIAQLDWQNSDTAFNSTPFYEISIPLDLPVNPNMLLPFTQTMFFRYTALKFDFEVNGHPNYMGRMKVFHYPLFRESAAMITSPQAVGCASGPFLDASSSYTESFTIPYISPYSLLSTTDLSASSEAISGFLQWTTGCLGLQVWIPLQTSPTGGTLTINVYCSFIEPHFEIPSVVSFFSANSKLNSRQIQRSLLTMMSYKDFSHRRYQRPGQMWREAVAFARNQLRVMQSVGIENAHAQGNTSSVTNNTTIGDHNSSDVAPKTDGAQFTASVGPPAGKPGGQAGPSGGGASKLPAGGAAKSALAKTPWWIPGGRAAKVANGLIDFIKPIATGGNLDRPNFNDIGQRAKVVLASTFNMNPGSGPIAFDRHGYHQDSMSLWTKSMAGVQQHALDFSNFIHRPTWTEEFSVTTSTAIGKVLTSGYICPLEQLFSDPPTYTTPNVDMCLNDWIASYHQYWRGGFIFRLTMTATAFHKVTLIASASYGSSEPAVVGSTITASEITAQYYFTLDFDGADGQTCFEFKLPWHGSPTDWKRVPTYSGPAGSIPLDIINMCSLGVWNLSIGSVLTANGDVPTTVYFDLEQCGAEDMQYYDPLWLGSAYTYGPSPKPTRIEHPDENATAQGKITQIGPSSLPFAPTENSVVSEVSTSFLDLIRRPQLVASFDLPIYSSIGNFSNAIQIQFGFTNANSSPSIANYSAVNTYDGNPASITNKIVGASMIQRLANFHRLQRGSLRFFVEFTPFVIFGPSSGANSYLGYMDVVDQVEIETTYDVANYTETYGYGSSFSKAEYHRRAAGATPIGTTGSSWTSEFSPNRTILSPNQPRAGVELPFSGIQPFGVCGAFTNAGTFAFPAGQARENVLPYTNLDVLLWLRYRETTTGTPNAITPARSVRVWIMAGDDFGFAHFTTVPQVYMNFEKQGGKAILYPPNNYASGNSLLEDPSEKQEPERKHPIRVRKKKTIQLEVDDSSSDNESIVMLPENSSAQVLSFEPYDLSKTYYYMSDNAHAIACTPGSFASFIAYIFVNPGYFNRAMSTRPPSIERIHARSMTIESETQGPRLVFELFTQGHTSRLEVSNEVFTLPSWTDDITQQLVREMCEWAVVNANTLASPLDRLAAYMGLMAVTNAQKPPLSIFNEMHASGLISSIDVNESPPIGPLNNLQWPITVKITLPDNTTYSATATVATKHVSKRTAAEECYAKLLASIHSRTQEPK